jgi:predicted glycoside hydrolase/deacetylase ChbG (UPF0249 family)
MPMNTSKKIIFTADDFGIKESYNEAVFKAYTQGFLTSTCICANGAAYKSAVEKYLPKMEGIDFGAHIDLIEGKSLTNCPLLTDKNGIFRHGFVSLLLNSFSGPFMAQVERETRAQIEKILKDYPNITHINSHVHTHAIPNIFNLFVKLAKEYNIPYVRTQLEIPYDTKRAPKVINFAKIMILGFFTFKNKAQAGFLTNDYLIGVGFTGDMEQNAIFEGVKKIQDRNGILEILIHPDCDPNNKERYQQFLAACDMGLKQKIEKMGFEFIKIDDLINKKVPQTASK